MENKKTCPTCGNPYEGEKCPTCNSVAKPEDTTSEVSKTPEVTENPESDKSQEQSSDETSEQS